MRGRYPRPDSVKALDFYVPMPFSFATNDTSSPVATANKGVGFTVTRANTGIFTVVSDFPVKSVVSVVASMQSHSNTDTVVQIGDVIVGSNGGITATIRTNTAGSAADIAADTYNRINLVFWCKLVGVSGS